ncbi:helix-turn-helix domain-containing protein [Gudongella sp. SC589]|uniref:helix-turn-helix domain-containing protein n=1 Tax=Gudongella sp. SC589 TaxID=3385990 RepID=UPI003904CF91
MSNFGTRLKEARKKTGITQKDLSSKLGIAQSTVANYENNTRFPGETILREISEYLNTSIDYLMGVEETSYSQETEGLELTDRVLENFIANLIQGKGEEAKKIAKAIHSGGMKLTQIITDLFIPTLYRLGQMWERDEITVAQEHYSTGIISSLTEFLSEVEPTTNTKRHVALFMTPGDEEHTLSLRFVSQFFRAAGWRIIFIGRSIPLWDLKQVIKQGEVDLVVLSVFSTGSLNSAEYLVQALRNEGGKQSPKILMGGRGIDTRELAEKAGADIYLDNLEDLAEKIMEIEEMIK